MSSKRKSPPTKLDGGAVNSSGGTADGTAPADMAATNSPQFSTSVTNSLEQIHLKSEAGQSVHHSSMLSNDHHQSLCTDKDLISRRNGSKPASPVSTNPAHSETSIAVEPPLHSSVADVDYGDDVADDDDDNDDNEDDDDDAVDDVNDKNIDHHHHQQQYYQYHQQLQQYQHENRINTESNTCVTMPVPISSDHSAASGAGDSSDVLTEYDEPCKKQRFEMLNSSPPIVPVSIMSCKILLIFRETCFYFLNNRFKANRKEHFKSTINN